MNFDGVIFDLDGTLLDSLEDLAAATNRVLARHGLAVYPVAAYRGFVGEGARHLIQSALGGLAPMDQVEQLLADFQQDYQQNARIRSHIYPGIKPMLEQLALRKLKLGVLSNKPHLITQACVAHYLGEYPFNPVFGQTEGWPRKPDPKRALEIARLWAVEPSRILYVGDTAIDIKPARAAGFYPLGVRWGFRPEELLPAGAKEVIDQPQALLKLL